ncbi:MAG: rhodanese-like domain-containing protein [Planctomycetes bacterium]|nr:rhodanese-like domain-containing protein [Planctomycetota bacterium]
MPYLLFFCLLLAAFYLLKIFLRISRLQADLVRMASRLQALQQSLERVHGEMKAGLERMEADLAGASPLPGSAELSAPAISADEARARIRRDPRALLLDLRTSLESGRKPMEGALPIPAGELPARIHEIPRDRQPLILFSAETADIAEAVRLLAREGFKEFLVVR